MIILRLLLAPIEASNFTWTPLSNAARRMLSSNVGQYLSTQSQLNHCELEYCPVSGIQTFRTTRLLSSSCNSIGFAWDGQLIRQPILELSSHLLEIPNDVHMLLRHILIGCLTLSEENCKLIGWYWKIISRQLYTITFLIGRYVIRYGYVRNMSIIAQLYQCTVIHVDGLKLSNPLIWQGKTKINLDTGVMI